jgi:pre-mRNA-splicing factor CWC22
MPEQIVQKTVEINEKSSFFGKTGGVYIPPARLKAMQAAITDKTSEDYQRLTWEALKKSLNGLINKVNISNIKFIIPEIFSENLVRGQGLLCKSIMKAQAASQPFTPVFAAVIAIINTKFPMMGELLVMRLLAQFRRAYKRSDKQACLSSTNFIAHLVNQRVANEIVALQILTLLLERPTDDSVEVAVGYMRQVGAFLLSESSKACNAVFERFRGILHEGQIDKRTQYMVEVLFQVRKEKFKDHPSIPEGLDIVEEEDQITHMIGLTDDLSTQDSLNVFHLDEEFLENEQKYEYMKREILGEESSEEESGSGEEDSEEEDEQEIEAQRQLQIRDQTNTNTVNLRRAIYLTIMSSLNFEECAHKLMKLDIQPGQEIELANMVIECCSQETTYVNFYGLLGERFCRVSMEWAGAFSGAFEETFKTIHRFETNRLRNIAKFFSHCLATDALSWEVFALIRITEVDTTSSSRIFCKILFNELVGALGLAKLKERLSDKDMVVTFETPGGIVTQSAFAGLFPKENSKDTRFSINYFTSIGLGALTEDMREYLKVASAAAAKEDSEDSDSDSDSSASDSSDSESDSGSSPRRRPLAKDFFDSPDRKNRSRSPPRHRNDSRSPRRRRRESPPPARRRNASGSPPTRKESLSPPRRRMASRSPPRSRRRENSVSPPRHRDARSPPRRRLVSRSPPRRRTSLSPPRRRVGSCSPSPRRRVGSRSPSPRRRVGSRSPSPRRRRESPPLRRQYSISPPRRPRRRFESKSPDRARSPPRKRVAESRSPPPRRRKLESPDRKPSPPAATSGSVHPSRMQNVPK